MTPAGILRPLLDGDERFAVTGATGWFGRTTLDLLDEVLGDAAATRVTAYASRSHRLTTRSGRSLDVKPLVQLAAQDPAPTHLLHFAFLTRDRVADLGVDRYVTQNLAITMAVLDVVRQARPKGLVVSSSGAVYDRNRRLTTDLAANPYGALKHLDEVALRAAVHEVGGATAVARVFSVAGAHITKPGAYALGSMIAMARQGGPVQVRAEGRVVRSYDAVDEVVALALWAVLSGDSVTFDSGGEAVEVERLAQLVAQVHDLPAEAVQRAFDPTVPEDRYVGDPGPGLELARRAGLVRRPLERLIAETSEWMSGSAGS